MIYLIAYLALNGTIFALGWTIHQRYYVRKVKPRKLTIKEYPNGTIIVYRWIHSSDYWFTFWLVFCTGIGLVPMLVVGILRGDSDPVAMGIFIILFIAIFGYYNALGFLNKTTLFLNNQRQIILMHGPLPGFRDPNRGLTSVVDFQYRIDNRLNRRFGPLVTFPVYAFTPSGQSIRLLQEIDSEEAAQSIVNALRQRLNIDSQV